MIGYAILSLAAEYGVSTDGKPLITENGMVRVQCIDWEKSNKIVKDKLIEMLVYGKDFEVL